MADKIIKGLSIQIGADTLGLDKALKDIEAKGRIASSELRAINSTIKTAGDSVVLWQQKQQLLNDALEKSREKVKILEDAQKGFTERFRNGEIDKGTYDKFQEKLTKSKDKLGNLKSQQEQIEAKFKSGEIDQGEYDKFRARVEKAEKQVKDLETAEHSIEENLRLGNISEEQYRAFQREIEYARAAVEKYEEGLKEVNSKVKDLGNESSDSADDVKDLGDDLHDAGEQAEKSSGGYTVLKGTLANLAADGIHKVTDALKNCSSQAMEFEDSVAKLSTIADDSVSIDKMERDIINLSNATGIAADELANTAYDAISAGQDTADAVGFVGEATNLARAGFADTASTLDLLTTILNAYGLESEKVTEVSDMLIQTQNLGKTTVAQLSSAMGKVIPTANACGVGLDQLTAAYAVMTAKGVATAETTTYLNSMLNELSKSGTTASDTLKEKTGKSFQELVAEGKSLSDVLAIISEAAVNPTVDTAAIEKAENKVRTSKLNVENAQIKLNTAIEKYGTNSAQAETAANNLEKAQISLQTAESDLIGLQEEQNLSFNDMWGSAEAGKAGLILLGDSAKDYNDVLAKMQNSSGATEAALEKLNTKSYVLEKVQNQLKNAMISTGKETLAALTPLAEKAMPKVERAIDVFNKNLPKMIGYGKTLIPVVKGVGAAFAAWKIAQKANEGISAIKKFNESLKRTSDAASISTASIVGVSAALVTGTVSLVASIKKAADAKAEEIFKKATEVSRNFSEAINENRDEMNKLKEAADETAAQDKILMDRTEDLWKELQNLVDKNGKVKRGYEDRVNYIKGELTETTGIEIELIDGQIQKYDELQATIEETINKQRAQKLSDAYGDVYTEALRQMNDAPKNLVKASEGIKNSLKAIQSGTSFDYDSVEDWIEFLHRTASMSGDPFADLSVEEIMKDSKTLSGLVDYAYGSMSKNGGSPIVVDTTNLDANLENLVTYYESYNAIKESFSQDQFDVESYEKAEEALANKRYDEAVRLYSEMGDLSKAQLANSQKETEERLKLMGDAIDEALKEYNASVELGCNDAEKTFQESVKSIVSEAKKGGITSGDILKTGIIDKLSEIDGFDTTALRIFIENESIDLGNLTGSSIISGVSNALGVLRESGGAMISAVNVAVSAALARTPLPSLNESDNKFSPPKFFAKGGFLGSGQGIVAEAGPELIEIMNGGARITPLTGNARNIAVSGTNGAGGQKNFYSSYTINATIAGKYDVTRLAEELEMERRRIEMGRGL